MRQPQKLAKKNYRASFGCLMVSKGSSLQISRSAAMLGQTPIKMKLTPTFVFLPRYILVADTVRKRGKFNPAYSQLYISYLRESDFEYWPTRFFASCHIASRSVSHFWQTAFCLQFTVTALWWMEFERKARIMGINEDLTNEWSWKSRNSGQEGSRGRNVGTIST